MIRRIVKRLLLAVPALILAGLVIGAYAWFQWNRLVITIRHEGAKNVPPASIIELSVRGDRAFVERLRHGEYRKLVLEPEGESDIELRYRLGKSYSWLNAVRDTLKRHYRTVISSCKTRYPVYQGSKLFNLLSR